MPRLFQNDYLKKAKQFTAPIKEEIFRYLHIFNNDITPVLKYIDELSTEGRSDYFKNQDQVEKDMSEKDKRKYKDFIYSWQRRLRYATYRKETQERQRHYRQNVNQWLDAACHWSFNRNLSNYRRHR